MIRGLTCIDAGIDWFDGKAPREYDNGRKCYEESLIKPCNKKGMVFGL